MAAVRSAAFGCCVLSTVAGLVRIFWPENGFKPVINAVLALYIITAAVQIIRVADWAGIAAELAPASDSSSVSDSEVGAYRRTLTDEAAAQAIAALFVADWRERLESRPGRAVSVLDSSSLSLCAAVSAWCGMPVAGRGLIARNRDLRAMIESAARVGPGGRRARRPEDAVWLWTCPGNRGVAPVG